MNEEKIVKKREKLTKAEFTVFIFISLLTIAKSIGLSSKNTLYYLMFVYGLVFTFFKVINDKYTQRELLILLVGLIIGVLTFYYGKETTMLFTCLIFIGLKNIDINKTLKLMFWIRLIIFLLIIAFTLLGILHNNSIIVWRNGVSIERFSFIYSHPNSAHLNLSLIIFLWIYLYYDKINIFNIVTLEAINYIYYTFTLSRTGFLITSLFLLFSYIYKNSDSIKKASLKFSKNIFIYLFFLTIILGLLFNSGRFPILKKIDYLMTGRLYYIGYFLKNIKIPLIGKNSYGKLMIDNGYMSLIYNGGVFALIWFGYLSSKTTHLLYNKQMYKEVLIIIILLTYSLSESYYMNIMLNFSLFFSTYYIYNSTNKKEE